jgi:LuxR family maltose regulon positive regulatory protein
VAAGEGEVLATKLFAPRARPGLVARNRLLVLLRSGLEVPLTILESPAGWGKSTAVADWLRRDRVKAGWVSLDDQDNDPKRFWRYLLLAAGRDSPDVAAPALRRLDAAGSDVRRDVVPSFVGAPS